jgi:hypothetical protein
MTGQLHRRATIRSGSSGTLGQPCRRPYASIFELALETLEEVVAGERRSDDRVVLTALVERLEAVVNSAAPPPVRRALTPAAMHNALLDWQDHLEVRDGREPDRRGVRFRRRPEALDLSLVASSCGRSGEEAARTSMTVGRSAA